MYVCIYIYMYISRDTHTEFMGLIVLSGKCPEPRLSQAERPGPQGDEGQRMPGLK